MKSVAVKFSIFPSEGRYVLEYECTYISERVRGQVSCDGDSRKGVATVNSCSLPELSGTTLFLRGDNKGADDEICRRYCSTEVEAIKYLSLYLKGLLRFEEYVLKNKFFSSIEEEPDRDSEVVFNGKSFCFDTKGQEALVGIL